MIAKTPGQTRPSGEPAHRLVTRLKENHAGRPMGVFSICSANRYVLEAAMIQSRHDRSLLLIESTSKQVNQFGGYTGQTPAAEVADHVGAGDSFDAGFIHQFIRRARVEDCLKYGNVTASLSVTRPGETEAFRDARHRESFLSQHLETYPDSSAGCQRSY